MYYSLKVMQNTQAKDDALAALDGNFGEMFGFDDIEDQDEAHTCVFTDPQLVWVAQSKPFIYTNESSNSLHSFA